MDFQNILDTMTPGQRQAVNAITEMWSKENSELRARVAELEAERAELVKEVGAALHHYRAEIDLGHPLATLATMHRQAIDAAREGE